MNVLTVCDVSGIDLYFPREYLKAALVVSLLSVWVLVGLFYYLNRYTKRRYFSQWTVAWLFYALWLTMNLRQPEKLTPPFPSMLNHWCVGIAAVFLLWGSYAQKKASFVDASRHLVLKAPHPSPLSAHSGFLGCRHFSKANAFLEGRGLQPIDWALPECAASA